MDKQIDIDKIVDYKEQYSRYIQKPKVTGDRLIGLCPFHDDKTASFCADLKTGQYTCFACGAGGNFITFLAGIDNISNSEAYQKILDEYHVSAPDPPSTEPYTPAEYAGDKHLPLEWLAENCHLGSGKGKDEIPFLRIPYMDESGHEVLFRKRFRKGSPQRFKWKFGSAGKLLMYGEWKLPKIREAGYTVLCEGESDTQTLWFLGFPALGIPGASTYKPEWTERLAGLKLYLHIEPDQGGQTFLAQMTRKLRLGGFEGEVFTWSVKDYGVKDPSDLFIQAGDDAKAKISAAIKAAKPLDINEVPVAVEGAPINLRQPEGWIYSEKGISMIDEKTFQPRLICRTPIILSRRLKNIDTGEEKIELAFKRDGEWHTLVQERQIIFTARTLTQIANTGCTITSENARYVVQYLGALEAENIDILEKTDSTSTFGWQPGGRFLPGHADGIALDIDPSMSHWAAAYCKNGSLAGWVDTMRPHRGRNIFRFILAAAFTAPLLRILGQRIFFVYNWGDSKGGKSAALQAALSAWGDPERLVANFNATTVALERMAGFYCDLPLGIDERQLAGNNQGTLEKIVYMLSSGTGKLRGSKTGGLQALSTWRTVVMATGEVSLTNETSQTGVSTRIIEVFGAPFGDQPSASAMYSQVRDDHGWAGPAFIAKVLEIGEEAIRDRYQLMLAFISADNRCPNISHAASIAAVATADSFLDEWLFGGKPAEAVAAAKMMAVDVASGDAENAARDVNDLATEFVSGWIGSNRSSFGRDAKIRYGTLDNDYAYIYTSIMSEALTNSGFNPRKTYKHMAERGIIATEMEDGRTRLSIRTSIDGQPCRVVKVDLGKLADALGGSAGQQIHFDDIPGDEPLPF